MLSWPGYSRHGICQASALPAAATNSRILGLPVISTKDNRSPSLVQPEEAPTDRGRRGLTHSHAELAAVRAGSVDQRLIDLVGGLQHLDVGLNGVAEFEQRDQFRTEIDPVALVGIVGLCRQAGDAPGG